MVTRGVISGCRNCLFLKQISSCNYFFKIHSVLTADTVFLLHFDKYLSDFEFLLEILEATCSCLGEGLFTFNISP